MKLILWWTLFTKLLCLAKNVYSVATHSLPSSPFPHPSLKPIISPARTETLTGLYTYQMGLRYQNQRAFGQLLNSYANVDLEEISEFRVHNLKSTVSSLGF